MKTLSGIAALVYLISIYFISSYCQQSEFSIIFPIYSLSFACFVYLIYKSEGLNFKTLVGLGVLIRILLLFVFPNLSDDIYRFYWDGILWWTEVHPFDLLPSELMKLGNLPDQRLEDVFHLLNSPDYYTIYPPFCQLLFSLSAKVGVGVKEAAIFLKSLYFLGDVLALSALVLLLKRFSLSPKLSLLYFLNPMIILELVGNIHAEVWLVCFTVWTAYFLIKGKYLLSGLMYSLAICSKILPLMFGPLILFYLWRKKEGIGFFISSGLSLAAMFGFMLKGSDVGHLLSSINLYFQSFEFNASLYYLMRWIGYGVSGYNQIAIIGPALAVFSLLSIFLVSWKTMSNKIKDPAIIDLQFLKVISIIFCTYLLCTTTVHPWYLSLPLAFSIFSTRLQIPILLWTFLIYLSYSAYDTNPVQEHGLLLFIEYGLVFFIGWMSYSRKISFDLKSNEI